MGSSASSNSDLELNCKYALAKALYEARMGLYHQVNNMRMTKQYLANNSDYKDQKQISVIKKSTVTTLIETKLKLQSFFSSEVGQKIINFNAPVDYITEFALITRQLQNFLSEEIFSYYETIADGKAKLDQLNQKKKILKLRFDQNQDDLRQTLVAKRRIVHKKTIISADSSISTSISNLSFNFAEGGALTERSLQRTMDRLKCVPKLKNNQMCLMSKIILKAEMASNYQLAKASIEKKLDKLKSLAHKLEQEQPESSRKYSEVELDLLLSKYV